MKEHLRKIFPERFEESANEKVSAFSSIRAMVRPLALVKCERRILDVFEHSDELRLLVGAMKKHGCDFDLARHMVCEKCSNCAGGYDPDTNQIVVCYNGPYTKKQTYATIIHEMIHMFDVCRAKFDFDNLEHIACTEIRAANLTFCGLRDRLKFGDPTVFRVKGTHMDCVRDVAIRSVSAYSPQTDKTKVADIVDKVLPVCYNDLEPFGRRLITGPVNMRESYRERFFYGYA